MRSTRTSHQRPRCACRGPMREEWGTKNPKKRRNCTKNRQICGLRTACVRDGLKTAVFRGSLSNSFRAGASYSFGRGQLPRHGNPEFAINRIGTGRTRNVRTMAVNRNKCTNFELIELGYLIAIPMYTSRETADMTTPVMAIPFPAD